MKDHAGAVVLFFIFLFAYTKLAGPIPFSVNTTTTTKADTFNVTGEGKVSVSPDIAVISAGVTTQGATVKAAQDDLNTRINAVSDAIKQEGVEPKDIRTANYSVHPQYDYRNGTPRITGYQAASTIVIKVRTLDNANGIIDAATGAGANQLGGISFEVDDKTKAENEAREKAVAQAKKKAEDAARIAGFTLGKIINYNEGFGPVPVPMAGGVRSMIMDADESAKTTQVEPGSNEITVTVTLSYEIR